MQASAQRIETIESSVDVFPEMESDTLFQFVGTQSTLLRGKIRQSVKELKTRGEIEAAVSQFTCAPTSVLAVDVFNYNINEILDEYYEAGGKSVDINLKSDIHVAIIETQGREGEIPIAQMLNRVAFIQSLLKIAELLPPGFAEALGKEGGRLQMQVAAISQVVTQIQTLLKAGISTAEQKQALVTQIKALQTHASKLSNVPGMKTLAGMMLKQVQTLLKQANQLTIQAPQARNGMMPPRVAAVLNNGQEIRVTPTSRTFLASALKTDVRNSPTGASAMSQAASASAQQGRAGLMSQATHTVAAAATAGVIAVAAATAPVAQAQAAIAPTAPVSQIEAVVSPTASVTATLTAASQEQAKDATVQTAAVNAQVSQQQDAKETIAPSTVEAKAPAVESRIEAALKQDAAEPPKAVQEAQPINKVDPANPQPVADQSLQNQQPKGADQQVGVPEAIIAPAADGKPTATSSSAEASSVVATAATGSQELPARGDQADISTQKGLGASNDGKPGESGTPSSTQTEGKVTLSAAEQQAVEQRIAELNKQIAQASKSPIESLSAENLANVQEIAKLREKLPITTLFKQCGNSCPCGVCGPAPATASPGQNARAGATQNLNRAGAAPAYAKT
jgi:hypothetical protein